MLKVMAVSTFAGMLTFLHNYIDKAMVADPCCLTMIYNNDWVVGVILVGSLIICLSWHSH